MVRLGAVLAALLVGAPLLRAETTAAPTGPSLEDYKVGEAKKAENATAEAAKDAKMAAVNKVVSMLESLQQQVIKEGEAEAATYDKFACFCKDMTKEKTKAIAKGKDEKNELSAEITKLSKERDDLDVKISKLNKDIEKTESVMAQLKSESDEALGEYEKNEADLSGAIFGLAEATKVLKASKGASLVQLQSAKKTASTALMLADALGLRSAKSAGQIFLQQAPEVEMEDYKFHSGGIVETLGKLSAEFQKKKQEIDEEEVKRVHAYDMEKQKNTDYIKAKTVELEESNKAKDKAVEEIAENSEQLTTVSATLMDDITYLQELSTGCSQKAKTWDQRSRVRVQEITAITEAMDIVKDTVVEKTSAATIRFAQTGSILHTADAVANDEDAMEALEQEAESTEQNGPVAFLQKRQIQAIAKKHEGEAVPEGDLAKQMVVSLLKSRGMELKSTLLMSLSTRIAGDPFGKIKKLIQELIERLLAEAANEANQKGWCDKALADASTKRDTAARKSDDVNADMAKLEATRDKLTEELAVLLSETAELKKAQTEAQKIRKDEKTENKETVYEATIGKQATEKAITILSRFYATAAKAKVDLSLSQGPMDDAPDAGFKTGEAYTAAGSDSGGVVGMLEVIMSDFERTIKETEAAEASAEKEFNQFMTESAISLAEKKVATEENTKYKDEAEEKLSDANDDMLAQTDLLATSIEELIKLQPTCIDTGMSYADRVAMREQEVASLKKALCILGAYAKHGPDGLDDAC